MNRDELVKAIRERLQQATATQDPAPVLEEAALTQARSLAETLRDDQADPEVLHLLGWLHWYRYLALPEGQGLGDLEAAIDMFTSCFIDGIAPLPEPLLPVLADQAALTAIALLKQALGSGDPALLSVMIQLWQRILDAAPVDHPDRAAMLSNLGLALQARFERVGVVEDLDAAIGRFQEAVDATPLDHPDRAAMLSNLGLALRARFERTGMVADVEAAIQRLQEAVDAVPVDHPDRAMFLNNLAGALQDRFDRLGMAEDLDAAIRGFQEAMNATPAGHPDRARRLSNLGSALRARFMRVGAVGDLDAAIQRGEEAVDAVPVDHPDRAAMLSNLGVALQARFERVGVVEDLDAAIGRLQEAVDATPLDHPDRAAMLSNLGLALQARFERVGVVEDLDAAIGRLQEAVDATPLDHPDRAGYLSNLGVALWARFVRVGVVGDLDAAIQRGEEAVDAVPVDHPDRAAMLSNLGVALEARFERVGVVGDLDAAIGRFQEAVDATPADHPDRARRLSHLGDALRVRFGRVGAVGDLDAAIRSLQEAVDAIPLDHPDRAGYLSNLGVALWARFVRVGVVGDLDAAIQRGREAVEATPVDHPDRAGYLSNLGVALWARFERTGVVADVNEAIRGFQEAVEATPADHPDRAGRLSNLGVALWARFVRVGVVGDLDAAIRGFQEAVEATPVDHPDRARYLSNLGLALQARFERTGVVADADAAVSAYAAAARAATASPSTRINAARAGAELAAASQPGLAADLAETAVRLLPQIAPRRLERSDQQHAIGAFAGLAADAAALALADPGRPASQRAVRALRLLEAARAVLLSQALHTRSDLTDLRARHPDLAARFVELRDLLDRPADGPTLTLMTGSVEGSALASSPAGQMARDRHSIAEQFATLLDHIRSLDGFASFALPPTAEQLLEQAKPGPVVVFNISRHRSDALLLTSEGITALELPALAHDIVIDKINLFHQALHTAADREAAPADRIAAQEAIREVLGWLWDAAAEPVLDALGYHHPPAPGQPWPRLWWAPGGLLGLLPIHAAGHHRDPAGPGRRTVLDRVVSSYTPTVGALRYARQRRTASSGPQRSLIVAMPTTPGLPGHGRLPNVEAEVALLRDRLPDPMLLAEPNDGAPADPGSVPTLANVLTHLGGCAIAHFACHGLSDPADPSASRLLLRDHHSDPLTVAALAPVALDRARLAYLSACSTALTATAELLDEAIHLASAFQLAGFPHVIGTLWPISDALAVTIADAFYTTLTASDGTLDTDRAALALHHAVRAARNAYPATPSLWAAHIHVGA